MTLEKVPAWSQDAERALSRTFAGDRDEIAAGVNAGTLELWKWNAGAAWMVTRTQAGVLTVCCFQGAGLRAVAPLLYRIAQRNRLRAVEFFTRRRGLARLLRTAGLEFAECETVYRCGVEHVQ